MIKWTAKGKVADRQLYLVHFNPTELGHGLAQDNPAKVAEMEKQLLDYLANVKAEKPAPKAGKPKKPKRFN